MDGDVGGEAGANRIFVGLVGDDGDALDPFSPDLVGDLGHRRLALDRLAAGHRGGVVVEDFVGDVDVRSNAGADRQQPRMVVGSVAEIGEYMLFVGERRLADPRRALAAHLGVGCGRAVHPHRHVVAADTRRCPAALGHLGRCVVRAARAEIGDTRELGLGLGQ